LGWPEVKLNFRRNFSENMMPKWLELAEIVSSVQFSQEGDALVWVYESSGIYSTRSLYAIINFRGYSRFTSQQFGKLKPHLEC
jgi:hypothetical protein